MARFQDFSIRRKLSLGMTLVAAVALVLAALASLSYEAHSFRVSKVRQLTAIAEVIGQNSRAALAFNRPQRRSPDSRVPEGHHRRRARLRLRRLEPRLRRFPRHPGRSRPGAFRRQPLRVPRRSPRSLP